MVLKNYFSRTIGNFTVSFREQSAACVHYVKQSETWLLYQIGSKITYLANNISFAQFAKLSTMCNLKVFLNILVEII